MVVPALSAAYASLSLKYLRREGLVIGPGVRTGVPLAIDNPRELGPDRIVNAVAAHRRHGGPCIVVDFGTATTFDAVSAAGEYLGGAIAPGIETSLDALTSRAARLVKVDLVAPDGTLYNIHNRSGASVTPYAYFQFTHDGKPTSNVNSVAETFGAQSFTGFGVYTAEKAYEKLGWHASDTHPLTFTDARVPESNLLGERGRGFAQFLATLDDGRVAIGALAVGCIQACLEMSVQYAGERTTFNVPIGRKQGVAFQVADLEVMLAASRQLVYKAAWMKDAGRPMKEFKQAAAIAKLYATESAVTATRIATQVFGGYGFMEEYPVARFYRDAKVLEIGEGTSEVQRMLIARGLGLPVE